jgi:hypothetical protein
MTREIATSLFGMLGALAWAAGAEAAEPIGPTSSATVTISVSVAPRFGLASESAAGRWCIATNSKAAPDVVLLVADGGRTPVPMAACQGAVVAGPPASGLMLIRAE